MKKLLKRNVNTENSIEMYSVCDSYCSCTCSCSNCTCTGDDLTAVKLAEKNLDRASQLYEYSYYPNHEIWNV